MVRYEKGLLDPGLASPIDRDTTGNFMREALDDIYHKLCVTLRVKNSDYSPGGEFANFEQSAKNAFGTVEQGIIFRMSDKFSRLCNLLHQEAQVKEESIEDTINDLIGYAVILKAYRSQKFDNPS